MGEDCYARAQAIVHEVLERPLHERQACLAAHCGSDPALRREVEWLIQAAEDTAHDDVPELIARTAAELAQGLHINAASQARYRLIERIGEGGMGVVWLAERDAGGVSLRVALKRLRFGSFAQQARFQEEQRILTSLNHPNIAYLIDAGSDAEGQSFLAMEYVDGERIDRWCQTHSLDVRGRIGLFLKVCAAVSYAHERLVIHRDIKPANLLVDAAGEPKLLDFGIARARERDAVFDADDVGAMTMDYASMEMLAGERPLPADDVYALGCLLFRLYSGRHPFEHLPADQACEQQLRPKFPAGLTRMQARALARALAFRRADRYEDATAFGRAFDAYDWRRFGIRVAAAAVVVALGLWASHGWLLARWGGFQLDEGQRVRLEAAIAEGRDNLAKQYWEDAALQFVEALRLNPYSLEARGGLSAVVTDMRAALEAEALPDAVAILQERTRCLGEDPLCPPPAREILAAARKSVPAAKPD